MVLSGLEDFKFTLDNFLQWDRSETRRSRSRGGSKNPPRETKIAYVVDYLVDTMYNDPPGRVTMTQRAIDSNEPSGGMVMASATSTTAVDWTVPERNHVSGSGQVSQSAYEIQYSAQLTAGENKNYYTLLEGLPYGHRISTAAEELVLQLRSEKDNGDLRTAEVFSELFDRGEGKMPFTWQWTSTALRVPESRSNPLEPDHTDGQGRKYWLRQVVVGHEVVGDIYVPEGSGRLVAEWNEVHGLPAVTVENSPDAQRAHSTHFWFEPYPPVDQHTSQRDIAVGRDGRWPVIHRTGAIAVGADYGRWSTGHGDSYRLVQGSLGTHTFERAAE